MISDVLKEYPYYLELGSDPILDGLGMINELINTTSIPNNGAITSLFEYTARILQNIDSYMNRVNNSNNIHSILLEENILTASVVNKVNNRLSAYDINDSEYDVIREINHYTMNEIPILPNINEKLDQILEFNDSEILDDDCKLILKSLCEIVPSTISIFGRMFLTVAPHNNMNVDMVPFGDKVRINANSYNNILALVLRNLNPIETLKSLVTSSINIANDDNIIINDNFYKVMHDAIEDLNPESNYVYNCITELSYYIKNIILPSISRSVGENLASKISDSVYREILIFVFLYNVYDMYNYINEMYDILNNRDNNEVNIERFRMLLLDFSITAIINLHIAMQLISSVVKIINRYKTIIGENNANNVIEYYNILRLTVKRSIANMENELKNREFLNLFKGKLFKKIQAPDTDVIHRDKEMKLLDSYLNKVWINNVILIGDPGVGKTYILEGLNKTSDDIEIFILDNAIKFFTEVYKTGNPINYIFESFKHIIKQANELFDEDLDSFDIFTKFEYIFKAYEKITGKKPVLFIDEIHHLLKYKEISDILKPLLTRKSIRIVGATTYKEYEKYIESDLAIVRRFENVHVNPFDKDATIDVLVNEIKPILEEKFTNIRIDEDMIEILYNLIHKYYRLSPLKDPGLSVSVMDGLFSFIANTYDLNNEEIYNIQENDIKKYLSTITNLKIEQMVVDSNREELIRKIHELESKIRNRVKGQKQAVEPIIKQIKKYMFGLHSGNKPIGVFLFLGPTGVGKTELAKAVAEALFGDENAMIRLDMSEFKQSHSIEKLWGSPPGYVGYGESGVLNAEISKKPNSVILLDEIEKAHPRVLDAFLQIFDDGRMRDGRGKEYDFSNTFIIMTSNMFSKEITSMSYKDAKKYIHSNISKYLRPEFVNRIDNILLFDKLNEDTIKEIVSKFIDKMIETFANRGYTIHVSEDIIDYIVNNKYNKSLGARSVRRYIENTLTNAIVDYIIDNNIIDNDIHVIIENNKVKFK